MPSHRLKTKGRRAVQLAPKLPCFEVNLLWGDSGEEYGFNGRLDIWTRNLAARDS